MRKNGFENATPNFPINEFWINKHTKEKYLQKQ